MSNFSTDSDLLACEPTVFVDLPMLNQQSLVVRDAQVSDATVTSATGGFTAIDEGDVVVLRLSDADAAAFAVAGVEDDNTLILTLPPTHLAGSSNLTLQRRTFTPQRDTVHEQLMRCIGIDPDGDDLDESAVISVSLMKRLEVLGTLWRAYSAAHTLVGDNSVIEAKAAQYGRHFNRALAGAVVLIDTTGDGVADVQRMPGVGRLVRS